MQRIYKHWINLYLAVTSNCNTYNLLSMLQVRQSTWWNCISCHDMCVGCGTELRSSLNSVFKRQSTTAMATGKVFQLCFYQAYTAAACYHSFSISRHVAIVRDVLADAIGQVESGDHMQGNFAPMFLLCQSFQQMADEGLDVLARYICPYASTQIMPITSGETNPVISDTKHCLAKLTYFNAVMQYFGLQDFELMKVWTAAKPL